MKHHVLVSMLLTVHIIHGLDELSYTMEEEKDVGYQVGRITSDSLSRNSEGNTTLRFALVEPSDLFAIHEMFGVITTTKRVDREEFCPDIQRSECKETIDVLVTPNPVQIIKVQIIIEDVNDNSPIFDDPVYDILIPESAPVNSTFYLPTAEDYDSTGNSVSHYDLQTSTQDFAISSRPIAFGGIDLRLVVRKSLDRELQGSYTLKLVARDGGHPSRSGMMMLNITIADENDNSPVFDQTLYSVRVPESADVGIMLTHVRALDRDTGNNGRVVYELSRRASNSMKRTFRVDRVTGELFLKSALDYDDKGSSYLLPIVARDSAGQGMSRSSQTLVNVTVSDENDNTPSITIRTIGMHGRAEVKEHSPNGTFVALIRVSDKDSGSNGHVTCMLSSPYFSLQSSYVNDYNMVVSAALDREDKSELNVTIWCSDAGSPPKVNTTSLVVHILDVNDQMPTFDRFVYYTMPIPENNPLGLPITQVSAIDRDKDKNAEVQYTLGQETDAKYFVVDRVSGLVTANARFDRETQREYTFTVLASDQGDPPLTASAAVYIRIADINDNAPKFNKTHYTMDIAENLPKYSFVGKVTATDADEGSYGDIWYRMVNASSGPFIIAHDTGMVSTRAPLDHERIGGGQYQVSIIATDYGMPALSSEVKITINVLDENDNSPMIMNGENTTFKCSYRAPVDAVFGQIKAADMDSGKNGELGFFIQTGNQYDLFKIDRQTGAFSVSNLIKSSMTGYYRLTVAVQDNGQPPHTVHTSITVHVTDDEYVPYGALAGRQDEETPGASKVHNVNVIVVVVLSSMSGILSLILIIAIIRIKRQKKENHSYNCRAEAQKLFHSTRSSEYSRPSCGSSWAGMSSADRSSFISRDSTLSTHADQQGQNFMTTFSSNNNQVVTALQAYDTANLHKDGETNVQKCTKNTIIQRLAGKEADSDSGNCDDVSIHNSTPMLLDQSRPGKGHAAHQPFHYHFLSGTESKPSSISSGNNSMTNSSATNSSANNDSPVRHIQEPSEHSSTAPVHTIAGNSLYNENHRLINQTHGAPVATPDLSSDDPNSSASSADQSINGDQLCEKIDKAFFSQIV